MSLLGYNGLIIALFLSAYSALVFIIGASTRRLRLIQSARNGTFLVCAFTTLASLMLTLSLIVRDFRLEYVASHTSRYLPLTYTLAAFWAGQEGSLLLWAWLLSIFAVVVLHQNRRRLDTFMSYAVSVMMMTEFFFLLLLVLVDDPFQLLPYVPVDGLGLNPLLQNPEMIFHPPTLLIGYVGFTVPFAFAIAALISRHLEGEWILRTRRWTIFAWFFLGIGTLLGAQWAYVELGWGGYWAWDPVENASLMPWLIGTAFLHSVMMQEKRGMLKIWNLVLIILTFFLCIFGTFLTRSGIISSVHTFASAPLLGSLFMIFMGLVVLGSGWLLVSRVNLLKGTHELDSLLSKESSFLFTNLIFIGMTFAVFWGTMYPAISELVGGQAIALGSPFFNRVIGPIGLILIALMCICPLLSWRKTSVNQAKRSFAVPGCFAALVIVVLVLLRIRTAYAFLSFALSAFALSMIVTEILRGTAVKRRTTKGSYLCTLCRLISTNRRRHGGYIVHMGVILMCIGITGSSAFNSEHEAVLSKGEETMAGRYRLRYEEMEHRDTWSKEINTAVLSIFHGDKQIGTLHPQKNLHRNHEQPITEVAIRSTPREDLYVLLLGWDEDERATFQLHINPLMMWMWIGGVLFSLGTVVAFWPERKQTRSSPFLPKTDPL